MIKRFGIFIIITGFILALAGTAEAGWYDSTLEELKLKEIQPAQFAFKSLSGDLIEIGEEKHSPPPNPI